MNAVRLACLALAALAAGCASVPAEDAASVAAEWSQRVDGAAARLLTTDAGREEQRAHRDRLLAEPLSESAAVRLALATSPALQALLAEGWAAQAAAAQGGAPPNPFFVFERVVFDGDVDISRKLGIGLTALLTWPWRSEVASARVQAQRWQLARDVLAHNADVRQAWVRAVAAQQLLAYQREVHDAAAAGAELARRMQAAGNFSRLQRLREQAFEVDATTRLAHAAAAASAEREALVRRLGLDTADAARLKLPDRLPDLPAEPRSAEAVARAAMGDRLDLLVARAELAAAGSARGIETVELFGMDLAAVSDLGPGGERGRGIEAGVVLPVLDPGAALRQQASARWLAESARFDQTRAEATSLLRERYAAYRSAWDVAVHLRDVLVPLTRTVTDEMLLRYNGMLAGVFDLLADARAQVGAVIAAIEAQRDFRLAEVALDAAIVGAPVAAPSPGKTAPAVAVEAKGGH